MKLKDLIEEPKAQKITFVRFKRKLGEPDGERFEYNDSIYKKYENEDVIELGGCSGYDGKYTRQHICFKLKRGKNSANKSNNRT